MKIPQDLSIVSLKLPDFYILQHNRSFTTVLCKNNHISNIPHIDIFGGRLPGRGRRRMLRPKKITCKGCNETNYINITLCSLLREITCIPWYAVYGDPKASPSDSPIGYHNTALNLTVKYSVVNTDSIDAIDVIGNPSWLGSDYIIIDTTPQIYSNELLFKAALSDSLTMRLKYWLGIRAKSPLTLDNAHMRQLREYSSNGIVTYLLEHFNKYTSYTSGYDIDSSNDITMMHKHLQLLTKPNMEGLRITLSQWEKI